LSGKQNTGKTTALRLLFDKITEQGEKNVLSKKEPDGFDFECVVKYNNKSVAVVSGGDYFHGCIRAIVKYANLDVLILAYSDRFAAALNETVAKFDYHYVVKKKRANDSDNEKVCKEIIAQI
jgi:hypothetical protein